MNTYFWKALSALLCKFCLSPFNFISTAFMLYPIPRATYARDAAGWSSPAFRASLANSIPSSYCNETQDTQHFHL